MYQITNEGKFNPPNTATYVLVNTYLYTFFQILTRIRKLRNLQILTKKREVLVCNILVQNMNT